MAFKEGETYKKVFGPIFVYFNSASKDKNSQTLWTDAVQQVQITHTLITLNALHYWIKMT